MVEEQFAVYIYVQLSNTSLHQQSEPTRDAVHTSLPVNYRRDLLNELDASIFRDMAACFPP